MAGDSDLGGGAASARKATSSRPGAHAPTSRGHARRFDPTGPGSVVSRRRARPAPGGDPHGTGDARDAAHLAPADGPRALAAPPTGTALERAGLSLPAPEAAHGRTVHPGDLPTAEKLRAEEAAHVTLVVETQVRDELAKARVEGGLVDPYYHELRRQLSRTLVDAPDFTDAKEGRNLPKTWAASWKGGAERYGKTGTAYEAPVTRESISGPGEVPSKLDPTANGMKELAMKLYAGARLRDFGMGKMGVELYAVVDLQQTATGAIEGLTLVEASGVATFDRWVLERASSAVGAVGALDGGARAQRHHSVWGFTGRVSYMRSTKELATGRDWAYLAVASLAGLTTGTFDEVSGEAYLVDLRNPHYECAVKLLRVYDNASPE